MVAKIQRVLIGKEDLLLGFGTQIQQRAEGEVKVSAINARNIPVDESGATLQDVLDAIYQRFGIDLSGIKPDTEVQVTKDYVDLSIHEYREDLAYPKGSAFHIEGEVYVTSDDIPIGTTPTLGVNMFKLGTYQHSKWKSDIQYMAGDIVTDDELNLKVAKKTNISQDPLTASEFWAYPKNDRYIEYWTSQLNCRKDRIYYSRLGDFYICLKDNMAIDPDEIENAEFWRLWTPTRDIGKNIGKTQLLQIPFSSITTLHDDLLPLNGMVVKKEEYSSLYEYLSKAGLIVSKEEWNSSHAISTTRYWYDNITDDFGMRDLRKDSTFIRFEGTRAGASTYQEHLILRHNHTISDSEGISYGNVGVGVSDEPGVVRGPSYSIGYTGGGENRPFATSWSMGVYFK